MAWIDGQETPDAPCEQGKISPFRGWDADQLAALEKDRARLNMERTASQMRGEVIQKQNGHPKDFMQKNHDRDFNEPRGHFIPDQWHDPDPGDADPDISVLGPEPQHKCGNVFLGGICTLPFGHTQPHEYVTLEERDKYD